MAEVMAAFESMITDHGTISKARNILLIGRSDKLYWLWIDILTKEVCFF